MGIPNNVSAAMTAADSALTDLEAKLQAASAADAAAAAASQAANDAKSAAATAGQALDAAKTSLTDAIGQWLTVPATPPQPNASATGSTSATPPIAGSTVVSADATGKP